MNVTLESLGPSLKRLTLEVMGDVDTAHRELTKQVLAGVIKRTPVDTGEARGGWQVSVNDDAGQPSGRLEESPVGDFAGATFDAGVQVIMGAPALQRFIVSNLTDHAWVLDQGAFEPPNPGPSKDPRPERRGRVLVQDGFSTQAPDGIIGPTISEVLAGVPQ